MFQIKSQNKEIIYNGLLNLSELICLNLSNKTQIIDFIIKDSIINDLIILADDDRIDIKINTLKCLRYVSENTPKIDMKLNNQIFEILNKNIESEFVDVQFEVKFIYLIYSKGFKNFNKYV